MRAWRGHILPWEQPASDVIGVREAEEMAHDDASAGLHLSACITTLICKCNELTMTRTTKWMYIYVYYLMCNVCILFKFNLWNLDVIWIWIWIWIYMPAVFYLNLYACCIFLIQKIIYRGGQIIKPATANQYNHGGPQKVSAAVK